MQPQRHTSFATVIACAVLFLFVAAPAALAASAPTAPNFPNAVPSQAGSLTGPDRADNAARAQQRYYSSYGQPESLTLPQSPPASDDAPWLPIVLAVAIVLMVAVAGATQRRRVRIRHRAARVAA